MSILLWNCKRLTKRIEKYENREREMIQFIFKLEKWIKRDKKDLNKMLKDLFPMETIEYGYKMGFINEIDYQLEKEKLYKELKQKECDKDGKSS